MDMQEYLDKQIDTLPVTELVNMVNMKPPLPSKDDVTASQYEKLQYSWSEKCHNCIVEILNRTKDMMVKFMRCPHSEEAMRVMHILCGLDNKDPIEEVDVRDFYSRMTHFKFTINDDTLKIYTWKEDRFGFDDHDYSFPLAFLEKDFDPTKDEKVWGMIQHMLLTKRYRSIVPENPNIESIRSFLNDYDENHDFHLRINGIYGVKEDNREWY